ncbi:integrase core domain protein [Acinetobacter sp. WC-323]|nr:integrase core domain protein [Acinetobacter sp. WC-323]
MKADGLKSQRGYRKPRAHAGAPAVVAANTLDRQFNPTQLNQLWVTDMRSTASQDIRTHEGWLYIAVVIDLFSRLVVGWSMKSRITTDLVLDALLMALWRRNPKNKVLIHSDQGSQYTSHEWQTFLKHHNLESSMSRRGNCHGNAVAESFFQLLKRERIKKKIYSLICAELAGDFHLGYARQLTGLF